MVVGCEYNLRWHVFNVHDTFVVRACAYHTTPLHDRIRFPTQTSDTLPVTSDGLNVVLVSVHIHGLQVQQF
jgi:hypothetical protein